MTIVVGDAQPGRLTALDGIRGLAILIVLVHNLSFIESGSSAFALKLVESVTAGGWTGVQLFFVLSGFLITGILVDALGTPDFFRTFYIRRTLRVFPLYYAFLAFVFFVFPLVAVPEWRATAQSNQFWFWTYTTNWAEPFHRGVTGLSHFWSLAVEEQFYLLWPLVIVVLSRRGLVRLCIAVIVVTPFIRALLNLTGFPSLAASEFTIARWDGLAAGALLALLIREDGGREWLRHWTSRIAWGSLLSLGVFIGVNRGFHETGVPVQIVGQTLSIALSACLICFVVIPQSSAACLLRQAVSAAWLRFLGKYSYAIYVFHWPIHVLLLQYTEDQVNRGGTVERLLRLTSYISAVSALSIIAAILSWHLLEQPVLRLKNRLAPRPPAPAAPDSSPRVA